MPMNVEFFEDKKVFSVACGEKYTIVATIDKDDQMFVSKAQKEGSTEYKTHLSNALRKKLSRRMSFKYIISINNLIHYRKIHTEYT